MLAETRTPAPPALPGVPPLPTLRIQYSLGPHRRPLSPTPAYMYPPLRHNPYPSQVTPQPVHDTTTTTLPGHVPINRSFLSPDPQPSILHPSNPDPAPFPTSPPDRRPHLPSLFSFPKTTRGPPPHNHQLILPPPDYPDHLHHRNAHPDSPPTIQMSMSADHHLLADDPHDQTGVTSYNLLDSCSRPRKPRRERPKIELAPDQPPTTQGRPRERVYVACLQCRTRKIRCDGAKPACHNCSKRVTGSNDCNYDAAPKRRGPDKIPGARQRLTRDPDPDAGAEGSGTVRRRRRIRSTATAAIPSPEAQNVNDLDFRHPTTTVLPGSGDVPQDILDLPELHSPTVRASGSSSALPGSSSFDLAEFMPIMPGGMPRSGYYTQTNANDDRGLIPATVSYEPSLNFSRKIWWDSLLSLYLFPTTIGHRQTLTSTQRETAAQGIMSDIRFVFRESNYFFSFFHVSTFFSNFFDPIRRERMQPSLVLALITIATFWRSSELGLGFEGRERALRFRDEAQSALEASLNAGWIDEALAQAAWVLAMFEVCAHPRQSEDRSSSSLVILDSLVRRLSLTTIDADNPNSSTFAPGTVAAVTERKNSWYPDETGMPFDSRGRTSQPADPLLKDLSKASSCPCQTMTLASHNPENTPHAPLWACTPAWCHTWSEAEIRKESCRRLAWSSMILAAGHVSYAVAHKRRAPDLFIADPSNYVLLFSGEALASSPFMFTLYSAKDTIWAIQDRALLLWLSCARMRHDTRASDLDKAQFAVKTWLEADALEASLNEHTCGLERTSIFQARETLFNTRMCISHEFQRYIPLVSANVSGLFHRDKAKEWLTHQANVAERFMLGLHTITGHSTNILARRPFFIFWFMSQISRALILWECDNTLTIALDVCKALLPALDYLSAIWPCPAQRYRYDTLRKQLDDACYVAGVNPPPSPNLGLPSPPACGTLV